MPVDFRKPAHVVVVHGVQTGEDEDINDDAQKFYKGISNAIASGNPLVGNALESVIDLAGDVVTAAKNTSTAHLIRKGLRETILESYRSQNK